jgi:hypothetical protein
MSCLRGLNSTYPPLSHPLQELEELGFGANLVLANPDWLMNDFQMLIENHKTNGLMVIQDNFILFLMT